MRSADRRPGELVLARPLHPHRASAGRARQQHGVERHVVGAVVAVAAGALDVLHDDVLGRQRAGEREVGAQIVDALAVRPDMHLVRAGPLRDRARGRHRRVRDEGTRVLPADRAGHFRRRRCLSLVDGGGLDGLALEPGGEIRLVGQRLARAPRRALAQGGEPGFRRTFRFGDDADEAAVAHHGDDAGNPACTRLVERGQLGARRCRFQHAAVQQAGQLEIVHEARPTEHLVGQVEPCRRRARDPPRSGRLGRDPRAGIARQKGVVGQLPIAGAQVARADDGAVLRPRGSRRRRRGAGLRHPDRSRAPARQRSARPSRTAPPTGCPR